MRREQQVWTAPQGVSFWQRLGIGDVKRGANMSSQESLNQRIRIHNRPSRSIHQERTLPHQCKLRRADQVIRFRSRRQDENDDLSSRQQGLQFTYRVHHRVSARGTGHAQQIDAERLQHALNLLADRPISNH